MYAKIYWAIWAVTLAAAGVFLVTGSFTPMASVVFGFIVFGLLYMGIISLLPSTVGHNAPPPRTGPGKMEVMLGTTSEALKKIKTEIAATGTVEVRKPKYP